MSSSHPILEHLANFQQYETKRDEQSTIKTSIGKIR